MQQRFCADSLAHGDEAHICLTFPASKDPFYGRKFPGKSNALLLTEAKCDWFEALDADPGPCNELKESFRASYVHEAADQVLPSGRG